MDRAAPSRSPQGSLARVSCFPCRTSKRRCNRRLPTCQLCRHKRIDCHYPHYRGQTLPSPQATGSSLSYSLGQDSGNEGHHSSSALASLSPTRSSVEDSSNLTTFPNWTGTRVGAIRAAPTVAPTSALNSAVRFLAPDVFQELRLQIPVPVWDVPEDIAHHLGDRHQLQAITNSFLHQTRSWMPIVNGKRHLAAVLNPLLTPIRRPIALLSVCMKLYCMLTSGEDNKKERHVLYLLAKQLYAEAETSGDLSISVLQAGIYIAIYEMAEAIYPAAYWTVGNLARYGIAMGLDRVNRDRMGTSISGAASFGLPWMDVEEMRRVWWGVLILDRFLNVSHPTWSLVTKDPAFDDFLPVDDEKFYNSTATPADASPISEAFHHKTGSYARLCQATHLISKALYTASVSPDSRDTEDRDNEPCDAGQLCRTLEALVRANEYEVTIRKLAFCSQSTVAYLGVLLLQQHKMEQVRASADVPEDGQNQRDIFFPETLSALDTLERVSKSLRYDGYFDGPCPKGGECTLFFVDLVYRSILALLGVSERLSSTETRDQIVGDKLDSLKWLLHQMTSHWHLASVYENILEAKEAMMTTIESTS